MELGTKLRISERNAKEKNRILFISFPSESNLDEVKVTKTFSNCEHFNSNIAFHST